jgi:probable rRNA maturation factor
MEEGGSRYFSNQRGRLPRRDAVALADYILRREKRKLPVNIIISDDPTLRRLNKTYRGFNRPTDVLSFPADSDLGILGEIYISLDTARQQAAEYGATLREEILRLVCHGVLHLCGYDHDRPADETVMKAREDKYLNSVIGHV